MKRKTYWLICPLLLLSTAGIAQNRLEKEVHLPAKVGNVPDGNDYSNPQSSFNHQHSAQSKHLAIFWDKAIGKNPTETEETNFRFDPQAALAEGDRFYDYFVNQLKFADKGNSFTDKYKMLLYVFKDDHKSAYGWGTDNVGIMWFRPCRMQEYPYCALAHELSHSFQYMVGADGTWGYSSTPNGAKGQAIHEMTSQWMLWQVYPEWTTIENYHLKQFMQKTHFALMHETNQYHSPYMLEYWSNKHGLDIISRIWKQARKEEDAVSVYKRITNTSQEKFNAEIYDAATRFITWDLPRIEKVNRPYANTHSCLLKATSDGWYQIAADRCPQNYGYNGIRLQVPSQSKQVMLQFKGVAGAKGFRAIKTDKAGWRYGFLAVKENGKRVYGKMHSQPNGNVTFDIPKDTKHLWLVVTGAPTEHWGHLFDNEEENDEQWPYQIKLTGTSIDESFIN